MVYCIGITRKDANQNV